MTPTFHDSFNDAILSYRLIQAMLTIRKHYEDPNIPSKDRAYLIKTSRSYLSYRGASINGPTAFFVMAVRLTKAVNQVPQNNGAREIITSACFNALDEMQRESETASTGYQTTEEFFQHGQAFGGGIGQCLILPQKNLKNPEALREAATELGLLVWAVKKLSQAANEIMNRKPTSFPLDVMPQKPKQTLYSNPRFSTTIEQHVAQEMYLRLTPSQKNCEGLAEKMPSTLSRLIVGACAAYANQGMKALQQGTLPDPSKIQALTFALKNEFT